MDRQNTNETKSMMVIILERSSMLPAVEINQKRTRQILNRVSSKMLQLPPQHSHSLAVNKCPRISRDLSLLEAHHFLRKSDRQQNKSGVISGAHKLRFRDFMCAFLRFKEGFLW